MNSAFYCSSIQELVNQASETILGLLAKSNPFALDALQRNAWLTQIEIARAQFGGLEGWIAFEFAIPRMGKRADVVLITAGIVFVIEFKIGSRKFDAAALDQVVDYALDLKNFHAGSHDRRIVPIVVATPSRLVHGDLSCRWRPRDKRRRGRPDRMVLCLAAMFSRVENLYIGAALSPRLSLGTGFLLSSARAGWLIPIRAASGSIGPIISCGKAFRFCRSRGGGGGCCGA
jgi:hypothetical protein